MRRRDRPCGIQGGALMQQYLQDMIDAAPASVARAGRFAAAGAIGVCAGLFFMAAAKLVLFAVGVALTHVS